MKIPSKNVNDYLVFDDYHMSIIQPFLIYADFECYNERIKSDISFDDNKPCTLLKAEQVPYSFAVYKDCFYDKTKNKLIYYTGNNCLEKFTEYLKKHVEIILNTKMVNKVPTSKEFLDNLTKSTVLFLVIESILRMRSLKIGFTANKLENF